MTNEMIPTTTASPVEKFLEHLNLPKILAGPAGEAISRLIGGAVDIPAAYLQGIAQGIKDKSAGRTAVSTAVAGAAAELAKNDPEIVKRAAHTLLAKELRHQENKEAIASKTIEILANTSDEKPQTEEAPQPVEEDWFNVFERYAEEASSDRLREMWARVLAGEIRKPKSISLQTLRFIAELDSTIANLFHGIASQVIDGETIPFPVKSGPQFGTLLALDEAGLVTGVAGTLALTRQAEIAEKTTQIMSIGRYRHHILLARFDKKINLQIPIVRLTRVGRELYQIIETQDDELVARQFVEKLAKDGMVDIGYLSISRTHPPIKLWTRETD